MPTWSIQHCFPECCRRLEVRIAQNSKCTLCGRMLSIGHGVFIMNHGFHPGCLEQLSQLGPTDGRPVLPSAQFQHGSDLRLARRVLVTQLRAEKWGYWQVSSSRAVASPGDSVIVHWTKERGVIRSGHEHGSVFILEENGDLKAHAIYFDKMGRSAKPRFIVPLADPDVTWKIVNYFGKPNKTRDRLSRGGGIRLMKRVPRTKKR